MSDLFKQTLVYGNKLSALQSGKLVIGQFFEYLKEQVDVKALVIYRLVCMYTLEGHSEFLESVNSPMYGLIYALSGGKCEPKIWQSLVNSQTHEYRDFVLLICDQLNDIDTVLRNNLISLVILSSGYKTLEKLEEKMRDQLTSTLVAGHCWDYLSRHPREVSAKEIHKELIELRESAPVYWEEVGRDDAWKLVSKLQLNDRLVMMDIYPEINIYSEWSELAWRIAKLSPMCQSYYLGLSERLTEKELIRLLTEISRIGAKRYIEKLEKYYSQDIFRPFEDNCMELINTTDIIGENVWLYSKLDRFEIHSENKRYIFTRPEFAKILKDGTNFWTNMPLEKEKLGRLRKYCEWLATLGLPEAKPLHELYELSADVVAEKSPEELINDILGQFLEGLMVI